MFAKPFNHILAPLLFLLFLTLLSYYFLRELKWLCSSFHNLLRNLLQHSQHSL